jgi:pyruvate/2-oxoglutarate dehydrogenase complex dihydrolipoamide dehydrogenase (E3) component
MRKREISWARPRRFDRNVVVIGAGSAGLIAAQVAASLRASVTLVEKHQMGGDCLNTGCVPSKALLRAARFFHDLKRAREFGARHAVQCEVSFPAVMDCVQEAITRIEPHDSAQHCQALGIEVVAGAARFLDPWSVEVTDAHGACKVITTRSAIIATGSRPAIPPIPGLEHVPYLTTDTFWSIRDLPRRLLVLGGGPVGCELGQAIARFGCEVTLVESESRLLPREDADVGEFVADRLRAEGVDVRVNHRASRFEQEAEGRVLIADHSGSQRRIAFDSVLVATGRAANLEGLGLEELGIESTQQLPANAFLQTNVPNIYAAGDVTGPYQFTHTAAHQAWHAAVNALFDPLRKARVDYAALPVAVFVDPEVARAGLNVQEATAAGIPHEVARFGLDDLDRAITEREDTGFIKVLTAPGKDKILGVTIVGASAAETISEFVLAMKHGIGLKQILKTVHIYPTMAEGNRFVAAAWLQAHQPQGLLGLAGRFHAWRRG